MAIGKRLPGTVVWEFWTGSEYVPVSVLSWSFEFVRAFEPLKWSLDIKASPGIFGVEHDLYPAIVAQNFDGSGWSLLCWFRCTITQPGRDPWVSPKLIVLDSDSNLTAVGLTVSFSGSCPFEALLAADQAMSPIRSTSSSVFTAHGVTASTCSAYGIASVVQHYADFPLPELDRTGEPAGWIREYLQPIRAGWCHWVEDVLHIRGGGQDVEAQTADKSIVDSQHIHVLGHRISSSSLRNRATVERTDLPVAGLNQPAKDVTEPYIVKVSLDNPVTMGTAVVKLAGPGFDSAWVWFDEADNVLNSTPLRTYIGATPAHAVQFTIIPQLGYTEPIPWELTVPGTLWLPDLGPYDENYSATFTEPEPRKRGIRPYQAPFTLRCCPNQGVAAEAAEAIVWEGLRGLRVCRADMALDVSYRCGLIVAVTCKRYAMTSKKFLVDGMSWSGDQNSHSMTLTLCRNKI